MLVCVWFAFQLSGAVTYKLYIGHASFDDFDVMVYIVAFLSAALGTGIFFLLSKFVFPDRLGSNRESSEMKNGA